MKVKLIFIKTVFNYIQIYITSTSRKNFINLQPTKLFGYSFIHDLPKNFIYYRRCRLSNKSPKLSVSPAKEKDLERHLTHSLLTSLVDAVR